MMPDIIDMDKLCAGCLTYEIKYDNKVFCKGYELKDINCPCQYCLVKVVCEDACEIFNDRQNKMK